MLVFSGLHSSTQRFGSFLSWQHLQNAFCFTASFISGYFALPNLCYFLLRGEDFCGNKSWWVFPKIMVPPKMDGENNGKAYVQMDDLGGTPIFGNILVVTIKTLKRTAAANAPEVFRRSQKGNEKVFQPSIFKCYCWWKKSCTTWDL